MRLSILLKDVQPITPEIDCEVSRLVMDSRHVRPGDLFIALKGTRQDGRKYIPEAIACGAVAVLVDTSKPELKFEQDVPLIPIYKLRRKVGHIAACFYDYPAKQIRMIGVTGTNGKTSCTHFIAQALESLNIKTGVIGTLGSGLYGKLNETGMTTPDAIRLQADLQEMHEAGVNAIAMEVSSHSIDQGRVYGIDFEIGIFTNLTQDHLDYHGTMSKYASVKRRFLLDMPTRRVIINANDPYGRKWIGRLAPHKPVYAYSTFPLPSFPADIQLIYTTHVSMTMQGVRALVHTPWGAGELILPLIGQFNLSNALAVLTALCVYGISFVETLNMLSQLKSVPGRMQMLGGNGRPLVVVDYAHTPDALQNVLQALRAHTEGKLICVFGCGGDRDQGKRPIMGKIAEEFADQIILTNDNPRSEKPEDIVRQIIQGFSNPDRVSIELDRSKAIQKSIQSATVRDCILVAGKGAEHYQQIGDEKIPFDDVEQVKRFLEGRKQNAIVVK